MLSNASREKTAMQKAREGMVLESVEKIRAYIRKISTQINTSAKKIAEVDDSSTSEENGKTRDIVAKKVGFDSGRQFECTRNVVKLMDEIKINHLI